MNKATNPDVNSWESLYWHPVTGMAGQYLGVLAQRYEPTNSKWDVYNPGTGKTTRYSSDEIFLLKDA